MIWANLLHLSTNMWSDRKRPQGLPRTDGISYFNESLQFDDGLWQEVTGRMVEAGMNMVVIDLGDGVRYESHPEIAVKGAWTPARLGRELRRLRKLGLEPIPKLNFSAAHDAWLGPYSRMVSTDAYYQVCRDLIAEVISLFDKPRFFHLGMDEESTRHLESLQYELVVIRQYDLWWHDLQFLVKQVERGGVRPWIWSDHLWRHGEEFLKRMPRSVLQSNWHYGRSFGAKVTGIRAYLILEEHGYDQVPTGSNLAGHDWASPDNFERTVPWCAKHISPARLHGFLQTTWRPTTARYRQDHLDAVERVTRAKAKLERKGR